MVEVCIASQLLGQASPDLLVMQGLLLASSLWRFGLQPPSPLAFQPRRSRTRIACLPPPWVSPPGVPALPAGPTAPPFDIRVRACCQNQQVNHFVLTSTPDLSQFGITKDEVFTIPRESSPGSSQTDHPLAALTRPLLPCGVTSHLMAHCDSYLARYLIWAVQTPQEPGIISAVSKVVVPFQ